MRPFLGSNAVVIAVCVFAAAASRALAGDAASLTGLSIAIVPTQSKDGSFSIDRDGTFAVRFTNRSEQPLLLWTENCELGYDTLSFRVEHGSGGITPMYLSPRGSWEWINHPLKTLAIAPGETMSWRVGPSDIWGDYVWMGVPEPNTGKPVKLTAVFEIKPSKASAAHGVWTGQVRSEPVQVSFTQAGLQTPHEYLRVRCPEQALRLLQADPKWIAKLDKEYEQTPLHLAASGGYAKVVGWLLENGADVNAVAYNRFTPLHMAKDPEVVKRLLAHKADVHAKDVNGDTALKRVASDFAHWQQHAELAAERDARRSIVNLLLKAGSEYDICSACYLNDLGRVRALLGDPNQVGDKEALREAARYGHAEIVKLFLDAGADPEDADYGGLPVSYFGVEHASVLKVLFDAGADPRVVMSFQGNGRGLPEGLTLLHEAAERGAVESVRLLLARGVSVDVKTPQGVTPLHVAAREGQAQVVALLLTRHANATAAMVDGSTPLSIAADNIRPEKPDDNARYEAVICELVRSGVELDIYAAIAIGNRKRVAAIVEADPGILKRRNPSGRPALHRAVTLDRREIVQLLLDKGCDPEISSQEGNSGHAGETALLDAAFWGHIEVTEILIRHGANVNARANDGVAPLHEAARMQHLDVARLLLKHGAEANAADDDGETPLDWANLYGESPEMSTLLIRHGGKHKGVK